MRWFGSTVALFFLVGLCAADDVGTLVKQLQSKDIVARREAASPTAGDIQMSSRDQRPALPRATGRPSRMTLPNAGSDTNRI